MEIRAASGPDRPAPWALLFSVGGGLALGLGLARALTGGVTHPVSATPEGDSAPAEAPAIEAIAAEPLVAEDAGADVSPGADAAATDAGVAEAVVVEVPVEPAATPAVVTPPPTSRTWSRIVRGRVAYLRCEEGTTPVPEGTPTASGCPRDAPLEAAVWAAIEAIPDCATAPFESGEVDLVVEAAPGATIEVRTRDRFAAEVVRMPAEAVLGCVGPTLVASAPPPLGGRAVISFRFRADP